MPLSDGSHVQISVYRVDQERNVAYGFSTDRSEELIVRVYENDGVYPGYSLAFIVQKTQGKVVVPVPNSIRVHQLETARIEGHSVEFATMVILSSKSPKDYEFWSPDFGYVLLLDDYHATRDIVYSAYVKRDYSDRAMNGNYLFSICSNLKQVEQGKKDNLLAQLREEEETRQRSASPAAFGTSGFQRSNNERWWDNSQRGNGNTQSEEADKREKEMKALANDVTSFLVVSLQKQNAKIFGEAWCSPVRTVVLTCDKFSGSTQKLEVGKWYEGVVKYSKRHYQKSNGFYVEKVWRASESPTTLFTEVNGGAIQVYEDLHFSLHPDMHNRQYHNGLVTISCGSLMSVQMTEKQFTAYEGQTKYCVMQYIPASTPDLCNWKLVRIVENNASRPARQQGEEHHGVDGEDHGPDRCDQFDDDDEDDDEEEMVPRRCFGNRPNAGVQRPVPYKPDQQNFMMGGQQKTDYGSYNNSGASSSNRGNWNFPNSDSGFVDATGRHPMGYGVRGQYYAEEDEVSDFGVVTESATRSFIIYSNRTQACFARDVPLTLGDWVQFKARKLIRKEGGCWYEAIPDSISKTDQLNPAFVDTKNNYIWMDVTVRMQYGTRPHPHNKHHMKVNTSDVGWVSTEYGNEVEPNGHITIDEMKEAGGQWRVWVQFCYGEREQEYEWWIVRVRGPSEEVAQRDSASDMNNLKNVAVDQEDLDIERQKAAAKAQMEMEQMNLGNSSRSSSRQASGLFSGQQNVQTPTDFSMNAPSSLTKADLLALWQINEVRTALKTTDFELYSRVEKSVADARSGSQTPVQRGPGLPMSSQHSNQQNSSYDRLRSAFGPSPSPAGSNRSFPQQHQYGSSSTQNYPPGGGFNQNHNNNRFM